ncbi:hypothetical protein CSA57_10970 [candidate division KSB3 bacterium]|nr:MAG: hypothetical protein CSA57_10970 [candidate division KSB3 bacterium]
MKRDLPKISWQNIAPPYYDYNYFYECERYPFNPYAESFDVVNAWWLAEIASLSYADEAFARPRFARAGFPELWSFSGDSTDCFLIANTQLAILAFRGTESRLRPGSRDIRNIWMDVKTDLNVLPVDTGRGMKVHQGFQRALDEVWPELSECLKQVHCPSRRLWMTGHSLGAALATLAAERYKKVQGLYTFGSPRVGDKRFREHFQIAAYRIVYNNDIVTELPLPGFYFHVGELYFLDRHGKMHHAPKVLDRYRNGIQAELRNIRQTLNNLSSGEFYFIPRGIQDHVPLFYTLHLWNALEGNGSDPLG